MASSDDQKILFRDFLFLFSLTGIFYLFNLGKGSLASWDEALYASVAKEVFQSGNWLKLTFEGAPWADKPPLGIWITAFFFKLFGPTEFSARLFSCLTGIGTVLVTYLFGTKLFGRWIGFLGALVLMSSSHFILFSRFGMLDAPTTFFLSLALYFFWLGRDKNRYLIFSGIAIGMVFMVKSFAALFIFPIVLIYCWWARELGILGRSSYWIGVIIAVLIALPWNIYETFVYQNAFVHDAVGRHLFSRTTKVLDGHSGNLYFYIRTMVNKYHPWALVSTVSAPLFIFESFRTRRREVIFTTAWIFSIFLIITLMATKLHWYIMPIYPALSLSVAYYLAKVFKERRTNFIKAAFVVIMLLHTQYSHIFNLDYSREIKGIAPSAAPAIASVSRVYFYNFHESPAAHFYLDKKIVYLDSEDVFQTQARVPGSFYCFIHEKDLVPMKASLPAHGLSVKAAFEDFLLVGRE